MVSDGRYFLSINGLTIKNQRKFMDLAYLDPKFWDL